MISLCINPIRFFNSDQHEDLALHEYWSIASWRLPIFVTVVQPQNWGSGNWPKLYNFSYRCLRQILINQSQIGSAVQRKGGKIVRVGDNIEGNCALPGGLLDEWVGGEEVTISRSVFNFGVPPPPLSFSSLSVSANTLTVTPSSPPTLPCHTGQPVMAGQKQLTRILYPQQNVIYRFCQLKLEADSYTYL